jgi:hypothetical protein
LEKKGRNYRSLFDIGRESNWYQVFGTNRLLWAFPIFMGSGKPLGDGIYWPNNQGDNRESVASPAIATDNKLESMVSPARIQSTNPGSNPARTSKVDWLICDRLHTGAELIESSRSCYGQSNSGQNSKLVPEGSWPTRLCAVECVKRGLLEQRERQ